MYEKELPKIKPSKQSLFELIYNGFTLRKIAETIRRSEPYVRSLLRELNLPTPLEFKTIQREMWKVHVAVLYMRLNGLKNIVSRTPFPNYKVVRSVLHEMGIFTDTHLGAHVMKLRLEVGWKPLPPHQQQMLEGELLGDGYLGLNDSKATPVKTLDNEDEIINALDDLQWFSWLDVDTVPEKLKEAISLFNTTRETLSYLRGAYYHLNMAIHATKWVEYIATQFRASGYHAHMHPTMYINENGQEMPGIGLLTASSLNLYIERLRWYDLVKVLPRNFNLTPTSLLHWLMGDGSFDTSIKLFTYSFHLSEVMRLALQLRQVVGVKARLFWDPPKKNDASKGNKTETEFPDPNRYWGIKLPVDRPSRTRFLDYLGMAPGFKVARRSFPWKFSKYTKRDDCI
jgi:hypothetical protein